MLMLRITNAFSKVAEIALVAAWRHTKFSCKHQKRHQH
jgi:hypothetical protein